MTKKQLLAVKRYAKETMAKTMDNMHTFEHLDRVRGNALKIVNILKIEKEIDLNLLQAACYLHDIHYINHRNSLITWMKETKYLKAMLPDIIKQFNLIESDRYLLSEAVYNHTHAFPFRRLNQKYSLYSQIVQDADQLEMWSNTRLINLEKTKSFSRFYKIVSLFSGLFIKRIKKNADTYLNFPQVIEYFKEDYM
ncbi:HD domain-containing protein [Patescibacteria group bacterium]